MPLQKQVDIEDVAIAMYEELPNLVLPVKEYLDTDNKTYTRELFIPKGVIAIGEQHAKPSINIITKGTLLIKKDTLDKGEVIKVPEDSSIIFTGFADGRKIVYSIEDTIFINVFHDVEATTLDEVRAELIIESKKFKEHKSLKELV